MKIDIEFNIPSQYTIDESSTRFCIVCAEVMNDRGKPVVFLHSSFFPYDNAFMIKREHSLNLWIDIQNAVLKQYKEVA